MSESSQPAQVGSNAQLCPCPCCGSAAQFGAAIGNDYGAYFVHCTNALCGLTTNLMFACMDDPKPILAERWNRRTVDGKFVSLLEAELLEAKGYIEELDLENDRLRAAVAAERDTPRQVIAYMATRSRDGTVRFTDNPDAARELDGYGWAITPLADAGPNADVTGLAPRKEDK